METHKLKSQDKSNVLHVGKKSKCAIPCPKLKVHNKIMHEKETTRYLGNILSAKGGFDDIIEDRRNQGWGKIATIPGILDQVDMGVHKVEVGIMLRPAIFINSVLFTSEAWSDIKEKTTSQTGGGGHGAPAEGQVDTQNVQQNFIILNLGHGN